MNDFLRAQKKVFISFFLFFFEKYNSKHLNELEMKLELSSNWQKLEIPSHFKSNWAF